MLSTVVAPLRYALTALVSGDSPRQLAAGMTLGMIVGFMPKGNLIAISLFVAIFALRVNSSVAILSATIFSAIGASCDSFAHKLGANVLAIQSFEPCYASIYNLPLGPWLGFNNTVVMGSLCIAAYLIYPVYWISHTSCARLQPHASAQASRSKFASWLLGAETPAQEGADA